MDVDPATAAGKSNQSGTTYFFCSTSCKQKFDSEPTRYLSARGGQPTPPPKSPEVVLYTCPMHPEIVRDKPGSCPICGMAPEPKTATEDDTNPELVDMSRRFRACLTLTAPLLLLVMGDMVVGQQAMATSSPVARSGGSSWPRNTGSPLGRTPVLRAGWASLVNRSLNMLTLISLNSSFHD